MRLGLLGRSDRFVWGGGRWGFCICRLAGYVLGFFKVKHICLLLGDFV